MPLACLASEINRSLGDGGQREAVSVWSRERRWPFRRVVLENSAGGEHRDPPAPCWRWRFPFSLHSSFCLTPVRHSVRRACMSALRSPHFPASPLPSRPKSIPPFRCDLFLFPPHHPPSIINTIPSVEGITTSCDDSRLAHRITRIQTVCRQRDVFCLERQPSFPATDQHPQFLGVTGRLTPDCSQLSF